MRTKNQNTHTSQERGNQNEEPTTAGEEQNREQKEEEKDEEAKEEKVKGCEQEEAKNKTKTKTNVVISRSPYKSFMSETYSFMCSAIPRKHPSRNL